MRGKRLVAASVVLATLLAPVFLALVPPLAAAEAPSPGELLAPRLERFRTEEAARREKSWYEPELALDALSQAIETRPSAPEEALAARFELTEEAAGALLEAALTYSTFERREPDRAYGEPVEDLEQIEVALLFALERTSGHPAARELLVNLLDALDPADALAAAEPVTATVARLPEAGRIAYELGSRLGRAPHARLLGLAFARLGEHPAILDRVAREARTSDLEAGCYGLAMERLLAAPDTPQDVLAYFAQQWLKALLDAGLAAEARTAFVGLPARLRTRLASRRGGSGPLTVDGLTVAAFGWDLAPALVAAALLTDEDEEAKRLLAAVPSAAKEPPPGSAPDSYEERETWQGQRETAAVWRLLEILAKPEPTTDAFDDLTRQVAIEQEDSGTAGIVGRGTLRRAFARLADREGYPEIADYHRRGLRRQVEGTYDPQEEADSPWNPVPALPIAVAARVAEVARRMEALRFELEDRAGGSGSAGEDAAAGQIARSLAAPRLEPFEERPLPAGIEPVESESEEVTDETSGEEPIRLPGGLYPVRVERRGDEVVALAVSQDYDPVGEVSAGAYWVVRSHDGGKAWSRPLYTGLRMMSPYVVRPVSELPLVGEGDVLNVEVEILEVDESTITLPPVGMRAKRQERGLYLSVPFAELERDRDGDGLTDLAEERLLTDRNDADTDGDGLGDAADPLPHVAQAGDRDLRAEALEAVLAKTAGARWRALVVGPPGESCPVGRPGRLRLTDEDTLFVTGDRELFAALSPGRRVVVLTPEEEKQAAEKFGLLFTLVIELLTFDRSGEHALVIWTSHWQGGTFRLDWQDGEWVPEDVTWWIT